jgi:hypothetical protein
MIVKNESKIITRLFDSVISIIDSYCICDTGSTDNTVQIITEYFENKNIPGKIVLEPFKNFCHNRNVALFECYGLSDYVLLLDADMVLQINNFDKNILSNYDFFYILQGNDNFYYQNTRIVKNDKQYKYKGVTHEYIDYPNNTKNMLFDKNVLFINDISDGGCKQNKFQRDIELLKEGIREEPNNERYYFYLANSYYDTEQFQLAIDIYKKRISLGGWIEEIWYSYYRIGLSYLRMNKIPEALYYWLEGYNAYPCRLENIYEIIKHYREIGKHKLCQLYYDIAKKNLLLNNDNDRKHYLFLRNDVYKCLIYNEYTIFANYLGVNNIDDEVIACLNHCNQTDKNVLLRNMKFYKHILKQTQKKILDDKINIMIHDENIPFVSSSSCLIPNTLEEGYIMNKRYVNYNINKNNGAYTIHSKNEQIITINKYIKMNKNFNIIEEDIFNIDCNQRRYIGIEDIKIYNDKNINSINFIGTGFHLNNTIGIVTGDYNYKYKQIIPIELKQQFKNSDCEKNWVFVDYKNSTHIIYNWNPLTICKENTTTNLIDIIERKNMPEIFSLIRGSTCGFKYNSEIWFVTHIVSYEHPRHYYHVIVIFDSEMNLLRYSAPFKFEGEPIEYCLSILVEDERVLINYSTWDETTRIGIYDKKYINSIVKYT